MKNKCNLKKPKFTNYLYLTQNWLGRLSPWPPPLPPGGEIVGPLALSSSQSTSNIAQLVGQDRSGSTSSHSEKKRTRELEGLERTTKNFTVEDLQPYVHLTRADASKRLHSNLLHATFQLFSIALVEAI